MFKRIKHLRPPDNWLLPVILVLGVLAGLFLYIFHISKASSYLSDAPETCVNCHIMAPQYATWMHSSHRENATCNDCHVPHNNILNKYYFKAKDGMRHARIFTLRKEPQVIFIKEEGKDVVQNNCIRCHSHQVNDDKTAGIYIQQLHKRTNRLCWDCHREVPHGRVNSLSSVPYARVPVPQSVISNWIKQKN